MPGKLFIVGALVTALTIGTIGYYTLTHLEQFSTSEQPVSEAPAATTAKPFVSQTTIGKSVEGRDISVTTFGNGEQHLLFVGGMHGGYEWNSSLLAYQMIDYLEANQAVVPDNIQISIIPDINPDATASVTGKDGKFSLTDIANPEVRVATARFNAHEVDLNRNFACKWQATSTWQGREVGAGTAAFSEPEAMTLRDYVATFEPDAVMFWHSKANNVYASECHNGVLPETMTLMSTYAKAAGYGEVAKFDAYPITGDAEGWLASIGIPAVTVELGSANSTEWEKNLAGTMAVIKKYSVAK